MLLLNKMVVEILIAMLNFNTSYVVIKLKETGKREETFEFQYILCCY